MQLNHSGDDYKLVSGLYYYDGESCGQFEAILGVLGQSLGAPGLTREVSGCSNSTSKAAYIQGSYDFDEKWSMTLGARYTKDSKEAIVNNGLIFDIVYPESGWIPGYVRPEGQLVPTVLDDSEDWSRFTPGAGVEYQYNNDIMFFASYSQGFKSGTFNPRATTAEPVPSFVTLSVGVPATDWEILAAPEILASPVTCNRPLLASVSEPITTFSPVNRPFLTINFLSFAIRFTLPS